MLKREERVEEGEEVGTAGSRGKKGVAEEMVRREERKREDGREEYGIDEELQGRRTKERRG